ncbi:MAG: hypothetical protein ACFKPT_25015 [Gloeotrichia echinulata GP01]
MRFANLPLSFIAITHIVGRSLFCEDMGDRFFARVRFVYGGDRFLTRVRFIDGRRSLFLGRCAIAFIFCTSAFISIGKRH